MKKRQIIKKKTVVSVLTLVLVIICSLKSYAFNPFPKKVDLSVGNTPQGIRALDFDQNTTLDLVVTNKDSDSISLLANDGKGNFSNSLGMLPIGDGPRLLDVADLNGDGKTDFVALNELSNNVVVFLGGPNATFNQALGSPFSAGNPPTGLVLAKLNDDSFTDLVVTDTNNDQIFVFLGNGDGTFTGAVPSTITVGNGPTSIISSRFNNDIFQDLAISNNIDDSISVLLGNGNGTFSLAPGSPFTVPNEPCCFSAIDVNNDSKKDLVITHRNPSRVSIFLSNGDGTFDQIPTGPLTVGDNPADIAGIDLNGDNFLDLIIANNGSDNLSIFLSNNGQQFNQAIGNPIQLGDTPVNGVEADFNGDGRLDYAVSNALSNSVTILFGNKEPSLTNPAFTNNAIQVTYTDNDGELPDSSTGGSITAEVDGMAASVTQVDSSDINVTDGKLYQISGSTPAGTHGVKFTASDGTYTTELSQNVTVPEGGGGGCSLITSNLETQNTPLHFYLLLSVFLRLMWRLRSWKSC